MKYLFYIGTGHKRVKGHAFNAGGLPYQSVGVENCRFWFQLGCSGQKANILPIKVHVSLNQQ